MTLLKCNSCLCNRYPGHKSFIAIRAAHGPFLLLLTFPLQWYFSDKPFGFPLCTHVQGRRSMSDRIWNERQALMKGLHCMYTVGLAFSQEGIIVPIL